MTKKLLYLLILLLLIPSFSYAVGVVKWSTIPYGTQGAYSCVITFTGYTQQDTCVWNPAVTSNTCTWGGKSCTEIYNSESGSGCTNSSSMGCSQIVYPAPYGCNIQDYENSVGGCGGSPIYCSTSPVYQKVQSFLGFIGDASRWSYYTTIGKDNNLYKCVVSFTRANGTTVLVIAGSALSTHNPVGASDCLSETEYNALKNTNCSLSSGWAINSGYAANYRDGTAVTQNPDNAEGPIVPTGSTSENPTGQPINSPTGFDGNKDGFDDVTGQPIPFLPGSGSGSGDSDGDGIAEVEIKDPEPSEIPAVPSQSVDDLDTSIESPEQEDLLGLFDIFAISPFVSLFTGQHILLSGMVCSLSVEVYGKTITFDFCDSRIANLLDWLGAFLVGYAALVGLISIFN